jgi:nucleotide-binding universal stress UspA family protein
MLDGPAAEQIIALADREKVDLIVICTHGRSGLSRWVYGSVAAKVLQDAPCPVFLVKAVEKDDSEFGQS